MKSRRTDRGRSEPEPAQLSEAESEVLAALWELESATVRQVNELLQNRGKQWAYTTVQTLLQRLEDKGCVTRDTTEFAHLYRASVSRDEILLRRLEGVAERFCGGLTAPLILALVRGRRYSPKEIRQFRDLLDQMEKKSP